MAKKAKKINKVKKEKVVKSDPANYVVVSKSTSDWMLYSFYGNGVDVNYFTDLRDAASFIKKLGRSTDVRVFKVEEELKVKSKLELDL
jgi:hypothetical protein